jgi:hypothetical protein
MTYFLLVDMDLLLEDDDVICVVTRQCRASTFRCIRLPVDALM